MQTYLLECLELVYLHLTKTKILLQDDTYFLEIMMHRIE